MTSLKGDLRSIMGTPFGGVGHAVLIFSRVTRAAFNSDSVVLQLHDRIEMPEEADGKFRVDGLDPGPIRIELEGGTVHNHGWNIDLPDEGVWSLTDLVDAQVDWSPAVIGRAEAAAREARDHADRAEAGADRVGTAEQVGVWASEASASASDASSARYGALTARDAARTASDAAEGHADRAATSESNAKTSETNAKQSEDNAGDYAAVATTAATEAVDAMESASDAVSSIGDSVSEAAGHADRAEQHESGAAAYAQNASDAADRIGTADQIEGWVQQAQDAADRIGTAEQVEGWVDDARNSASSASSSESKAKEYRDAAATAASSAVDDARVELGNIASDAADYATESSRSAARAKTSETNAATHEANSLSAAERAEFAAEETIQQVEGDFATRNYTDTAAENARDEAVGEFNKVLDSSPNIPRLQEIEDYLAVLVDSAGTPTDLAIRSSDGQLADWVVKRLAPRIEKYLGTGGSAAAENLTRFPVMGGRLATNRVNGTPSNFVFCGSSTTENSDPTGYVSLVVDGMQERYPSTAKTATQFSTTATWGTVHTEPGIHGYGAGIGGTTSANYLNATRVSRIAALEPTAVLHMIGANDSLFSTPYDQYRQNVESWIDQIDAATNLPTQHILVHTYPRWGQAASGPNPGHYKYSWEGYGQELQRVAAARTNVGFIDNNPAFQAVGVDGSGSDPLNLILPDEVHATARGYRLIADLILEALTNIH